MFSKPHQRIYAIVLVMLILTTLACNALNLPGNAVSTAQALATAAGDIGEAAQTLEAAATDIGLDGLQATAEAFATEVGVDGLEATAEAAATEVLCCVGG